MNKNILLTGAPSCGKTTIIKKIFSKLNMPVQGFYTEEERVGDRRVGFMMNSLDLLVEKYAFVLVKLIFITLMLNFTDFVPHFPHNY